MSPTVVYFIFFSARFCFPAPRSRNLWNSLSRVRSRVAKARKTLKEPENDGQQGVGALGADEIVYDNTEGKGVDDDTSVQQDTMSGNPNWLDRLQTGPKEFLKNKFSYQYRMKEGNDAK